MFCSNKNCSPRSVILFLIIAAAVFWLMWFGTASLLGKNQVEEGLQQISAQLTEITTPYGKSTNITHGGITIEGWGYHKQAVVKDVAIDISSVLDPLAFKISLGDVIVSSDPLDYRRLLMKLAGPVHVTQNDNAIVDLNFSEPLIYAFMEDEVANYKNMQHSLLLPKQISVEKLMSGSADASAASDASKQENTMVISFSSNPTLQYSSVPDQKTSSLVYSLSGMKFVDGGQDVATIGKLVSTINKTIGDAEGMVASKNSLKIDDLVVFKNHVATKPYAVDLDADVAVDENPPADPEESHTPVPTGPDAANADVNNSGPSENRYVTLNSFIITDPEFKLVMTGKFSNLRGDPLPSGDLNISIDNLPQFLSSELISSMNFTGLDAAVAKITGQPLAGQTNVSFALTREKGGTMHVGKTTFEELVASMFSAGSLMPGGVGGRMPDVESMPSVPTGLPHSAAPESALPTVDLPVAEPKK